jgi:hypothetical protein
VGLSDSQVDGERGLGHHLGIDDGLWGHASNVAVDSRVQVKSNTRGGVGHVGIRLRGAGGGLRREAGHGVADAGLGREDVGVG